MPILNDPDGPYYFMLMSVGKCTVGTVLCID